MKCGRMISIDISCSVELEALLSRAIPLPTQIS